MLFTWQAVSIIISIIVIGGGLIANAAVAIYKANRALNKTYMLETKVNAMNTSIAEYFGRFDERTKAVQHSVKEIRDKLILNI